MLTRNVLGPIRVVVQRCNKASLLIDAAKDEWTSIGRGLVLYVSFAEGASLDMLPGACKSLLLAPLSTADKWSSDHSDAESVIGLVKAGTKQGLLVVPQASLVAKLERGDKYLKYYKQCRKEEAEALFRGFVRSLGQTAGQLLAQDGPKGGKKEHGPSFEELKALRESRAMVDPAEYFRSPDEDGKPQPYSAWDERGVPTHDTEGNEIPKSGKKRLEKLFAAHVKKWEKAKEKAAAAGESGDPLVEPGSDRGTTLPAKSEDVGGGAAQVGSAAAPSREEDDDRGSLFADLAEGLLEVRHGSFGGRQGFSMESAGPLTHSFAF